MTRRGLLLVLMLALPVTLAADSLVLRDGSRIEGDLVSVRNGLITFEERRGYGRGRRLELEVDEVARIEFEAPDRFGRSDFGRPAGMRERQVSVLAAEAWTDTGIDVRAGQSLYVEATGQVRWGRDRRDGPGGERNSPHNPNRPLPSRPAAALIGKIGQSSNEIFFIGDEEGAIRVRATGRLLLGINDDYVADNTGQFRVTIYY